MPETSAIGAPSRAAVVNVWFTQLDGVDDAGLARYKSWFTAVERAQFAGFLNERRRREFIVGRGLARLALASETNEAPESFEFESDPKGKLSVALPTPARAVNFNISHTSGLVACATCKGFAIGLDIERFSERLEPLLIARRFFSEAEANTLDRLDDAARRDRFYTLWTLKEALAKAHGLGLGVPLDASQFDFHDDGSFEAVSDHTEFKQGATLAVASPLPEYRWALCVRCDASNAVQIRVCAVSPDWSDFAHEINWTQARLKNSTIQLDAAARSRQPSGHAP